MNAFPDIRPAESSKNALPAPFPLVAVDVGNTRAKFGLFPRATASGLPEPAQCLHVPHEGSDLDVLGSWLAEAGFRTVFWWIGSVNRPAGTRLVDWLRSHRAVYPIRLLAAGDLPLSVAVERPDMVGVDRLLDALAANGLRTPDQPAVVVDVGTAITVDLVSREGVFLGGAILPGIGMSAKALHAFTDLLPLVEVADLSPLRWDGPPIRPCAPGCSGVRSGPSAN